MPKVSVIVPVYNSTAHLEQCIDSILGQTLFDIEVICVDDGSDDGSLDVLERYAQQDARLTVLKQKHQYAGMARNLGKASAQGKYLVFWDSDDYFMPDALQLMYEQCETDSADICICAGRQCYEDLGYDIPTGSYVRMAHIPEEIPFNRHTNSEHVLNVTVEAAWNKMFRADFVKSTGLDFQGTRNGNDVFFVECSLALAERITVVEKPLIVYRKSQSTGLVATLSSAPLTALQAWVDTSEELRRRNAFPEKSFANKALDSVIHLLHNMATWDAFREGVLFLQNGALDKLGIIEQEEGYYYKEWYDDFVVHLRADDPEHFLAYFSYLTYLQHMRLGATKRHQKEILQERVNKLRKNRAKTKAHLEEIQAENSALRAEIDRMRRALEVSDAELMAARREIAARKARR